MPSSRPLQQRLGHSFSIRAQTSGRYVGHCLASSRHRCRTKQPTSLKSPTHSGSVRAGALMHQAVSNTAVARNTNAVATSAAISPRIAPPLVVERQNHALHPIIRSDRKRVCHRLYQRFPTDRGKITVARSGTRSHVGTQSELESLSPPTRRNVQNLPVSRT